MSATPAPDDVNGAASSLEAEAVRSIGADRVAATIIAPSDGLVIGRCIAIVVLALFVFSLGDGRDSVLVGVMLLVIAAIQPLIAVLWPTGDSFRRAQLFSDLVVFVVIVAIAPEYFVLGVIAVAALHAHFAMLAPLSHYVQAALLGVVAVAVMGVLQDIDQIERIVGLLVILAVSYGYMGYRTQIATEAARKDLLSAITTAGGLAFLVDLTENWGVVDVVGDIEKVVGWSRDEWLSTDHHDLIHPDDIDDFWIDVDTVPVGAVVDRTARTKTKSGEWIWLRDMARVVMVGNRKFLRGFTIDVTAEQSGMDRLTEEASTDDLTGLRNRRWLRGELESRAERSDHYLVLMDLNRFKYVNDTLGHDAGDELLETVAQRLTGCLRSDDVLARLGGDEFAIIMDHVDDADVVAAAVDRFAYEVSRPVEINRVTLGTSVSAGISPARPGRSDASTMLRQADIAMYTAKRQHVVSATFDGELAELTDRRSTLSADLPTALANHDIVLHYQPIVDVVTGAITGMEGLARWQHASYGLLRPDSFLDVVLLSEHSGEFTRAMVQQGIVVARRLADHGLDLPVSVNLPIRAVEDQAFEHWFVDECERNGVDPGRIVFEIAEQDIHEGSIIESIDRLAAVGVTIAVDDFGAGYASFDRLRWRRVGQLKIDRRVLNDAASDDRDVTILRAVIALANDLGYEVVAEGVEREAQLDLLRELDCRYAQGYLFGYPVPFDELLSRIEAEKPAVGGGTPNERTTHR